MSSYTSENQTLSTSFPNRSSKRRQSKGNCSGVEKEQHEEEECDEEAWQTLSKNFKQVQSVLDQNRVLIQQVNENHQSKVADNMAENVSLIREINGNISKVLGLYSDLSVNFSTMVHQRRVVAAASGVKEGGENSKGSSSDRIQRIQREVGNPQ